MSFYGVRQKKKNAAQKHEMESLAKCSLPGFSMIGVTFMADFRPGLGLGRARRASQKHNANVGHNGGRNGVLVK